MSGSEERLMFVHYHSSVRRAYLYEVSDLMKNEASPLYDHLNEHVSVPGRNTAGIDTILPLVWSNDKLRFMLRGYDANARASNLFVFDMERRTLAQKTHLIDHNVAADYQWVGSNAGALYRVENLNAQGVGLFFKPRKGENRPIVTSANLAPNGQVFEHFSF